MRNLLFTILFLLMLSVSTLAIDVSVDPITVSSWRFPMTQVKMRIYPNQTFLTSEGELIQKGIIGRSQWYKEVTCTVSGNNITIPSLTIDSTDDSDIPAASYTAVFFDNRGSRIDNYYVGFRVPSTYGSSVSWQEIRAYTESVSITLPSGYYPVATTDTRLEKDLSLYSNSLTTAVSALGVQETVLACTRATTLSSSLSIPRNIKLKPTGECLITLGASVTLTIGSMEPTWNKKVFVSSASGASVVFSKGAVPEINLAWWVGNNSGAGTDATDALSEAVTSANANFEPIYVPSGIWTISTGQILTDGVTIRGAGVFPATGYGTALKLSSPTTSYLFKVGQGEYSIQFQDIVLDGTGTTNRVGVLYEGASPNTSADVSFDNVHFIAFQYGFQINSTASDWQVAQVKFNNSNFILNTSAGIRANSVNGQITTQATNFSVPSSAWAVDCASCGLVTLVGGEFGGSGVGGTSGLLRTTGAHGAINFIGTQDENFGTFFQNDASDISGVINIVGSLVQAKIMLNESCTVNSFGSNYLSNTFQDSGTAAAVVTSHGDHIRAVDVSTTDGSTPVVSPPKLSNFTAASIVVSQTNGINYESYEHVPKFIIKPVALNANTVPVLNLGYKPTTDETQILMRMGRLTTDYPPVFDYYYDWKRQNSGDEAGALLLEGNQTGFTLFKANSEFAAQGAVRSQGCALVDGATITVTPKCGNHHYVTLGGNRTFAVATMNATEQTRADGQRMTIEIIQDGTGSRTCALTTGAAGQFKFGTDIASITCTTTAAATDILEVVYSKRQDRWLVTSFVHGF